MPERRQRHLGGFSSGPVTTNWSVDSGGVNDAGQIVGGVSNVVFSASSAQGADQYDARRQLHHQQPDRDHQRRGIHRGQQPEPDHQRRGQHTGGMGYAAGNGIVMQPGAGAAEHRAGSVIPAANQSWTNNSGSLLTVSSNVTGAAMTGNTTVLTLAGSGSGGSLLSGIIGDGSGGGKLALVVNTTGGAVELTGSNTYTGANDGQCGVLLLGNSATIQNSTVTVNAANGLAFIAGLALPPLPGLSGSSGFALNDQATPAGPISLIVGSNNASTVYSGAMSGSGSLTKSGSGTLTLSGVNTFTGHHGQQRHAGLRHGARRRRREHPSVT